MSARGAGAVGFVAAAALPAVLWHRVIADIASEFRLDPTYLITGHAFEEALPIGASEALKTVDDLLGLIAPEVGDREAMGPVLPRLMLEAMREAERDAALRERMGAMLGAYRGIMVDVVPTRSAARCSPARPQRRSRPCWGRSATGCCSTLDPESRRPPAA